MGRVKKVEKGWRAGKGEGRGSSAGLASGQAGKKKRAGRGNWAFGPKRERFSSFFSNSFSFS